jgi:hypothetical protein
MKSLDPFTTLSPRQQITSTPHAIRTLTAAIADTATNATQLGNNILVGTPGQGIILNSSDGAMCKLLSIDNAGAVALSTFACP